MTKPLELGEHDFGGFRLTVAEDPESGLTAINFKVPDGRTFRAYFSPEGLPVQPRERDSFLDFVQASRASGLGPPTG